MKKKYWLSNNLDGNCLDFTIILDSNNKEESIVIKESEEYYDTTDIIIHVNRLENVRKLLKQENLLDDFLDAILHDSMR